MRRCFVVAWNAVALAACSSSGGPAGESIATVTVTPSAPSTIPGGSVQLTAGALDAAGQSIAGAAFTWTSSAPTVATVSGTGRVTGVTIGSVTITAASGAKSGSTVVTVASGASIGATGGTVTSADGQVTITIPAGALASSTPITIAPRTATAGSTSEIVGTTYDFGPTGTQFTLPVTVRIAYDPAHLKPSYPAGTAHLEVQLGGTWTPLDNASVDTVAHLMVGTVTHFSPFRGSQYERFFTDFDFSDGGRAGDPAQPLPPVAVGGTSVCDSGGTTHYMMAGGALGGVPVVSVVDPNVASVSVSTDNQTYAIVGKSPGSTAITAASGGVVAAIGVTVIHCSSNLPLASTVVNGSLDNIDYWAGSTQWITTTGGTFRYPALGGAQVPAHLRAALRAPRPTALAYRDATAPQHEAIYWDGFPGNATLVNFPSTSAPFGNGAFAIDNEFIFGGPVGAVTEVYGVPDHGTSATRLTNLGGSFNNIAVTADSTIYFDWHPGGQAAHIYRMRLPVLGSAPPTSGQVQVTTSSLAETQPAISANGRVLAYTQNDALVSFSRIYITALTPGSTPIAVTPASGFAFSPAWCGNGMLYYTFSTSVSGPYQVMRWDPVLNVSTAVSRLNSNNVFELGIARTDGDGGVHRCPQ